MMLIAANASSTSPTAPRCSEVFRHDQIERAMAYQSTEGAKAVLAA